MKTTMRGVVHGKTIELEQAPGLPDGQQVGVTIEPLPPAGPEGSSPSEGLRRAFGAWADDAEELAEIFRCEFDLLGLVLQDLA